jgi:glycosyltransferase involved in cell wall biosynthesis
MAISAADIAAGRVLPRTLAGATVLQIIESLRDSPSARATVGVAHALVRAGARTIVAGEQGSLVRELRSFGGEWLPFASSAVGPIKRRREAEMLEKLVGAERVDIVHAKTARAARSALPAREHNTVWLVTELPDLPRSRMRWAAFRLRALSRGDRIIARSLFNAGPLLDRYRIPEARVTVIPRSIDTSVFNAAAVQPVRAAALRHAWGIPSGVRVVLVPGRVAPWAGQMMLVEAARRLVASNLRGVTFVLAGDDQRHRRYARAIMRRAQEEGVETLFRLVGHCEDMAAAYAAADIVVVPYLVSPVYGRVVAEAQAMARPVIASSAGTLPENLLAPPRMPNELRTGWVVQPGEASELARALATALSLDAAAYRALAARARQFGEFMFAPERAVAATLELYKSLLEAER